MNLELTLYPDKILNRKLAPVKGVDAGLRKLVQDMRETMYVEGGIGLAANQVGVDLRVLVVDPYAGSSRSAFLALINPKLLAHFGDTVNMEEGCLSFPDIRELVTRPDGVEIEFLDEEGLSQKIKATGLLSRVLQHEYDHLEGKTLLDRISTLRRLLLVKKLRELRKART